MSKKTDKLQSKPAPVIEEKPKRNATARTITIIFIIVLIVAALRFMRDINRGDHVKLFGLEFNKPENIPAPSTSSNIVQHTQRHLTDSDLKAIIANLPDKSTPIIVSPIGPVDAETNTLKDEIVAKLSASGFNNITIEENGYTGKYKPGKVDLVKTSRGMEINIYPQDGAKM